MPYNFAADSFYTKKLCSRLSSSEVWFYTESGRFAFLSAPLGDLGATYGDHLRLIGKCVVDFLLVLIELFSLGVTAEALRANISSKSIGDFAPMGPVDPKFLVEWVAPHQPFFFSERVKVVTMIKKVIRSVLRTMIKKFITFFKIGWRHQLRHRVTPTLVTPLQCKTK